MSLTPNSDALSAPPHAQQSSQLPSLQLSDRWRRSVSYLRVSVTDRCNYACTYCAPLEGWQASPRQELLSLEELFEVIAVMVSMGVKRVRFTGGEPLLRRELTTLMRRVAALEGVQELALTTNAHLLDRYAQALFEAGVRRLNVSLDTFDEADFKRITRGGDLKRVLRGVERAQEVGFRDIQINAVLTPELPQSPELWRAFVERCWSYELTPRWIELMPIGDLSSQRPTSEGHPLNNELVREALIDPLKLSAPNAPNAPNTLSSPPRGPAHYLVSALKGSEGRKVGFIDPLSDDGFCSTCNRARLTARGGLRACLADDREVDLKEPLRAGLHGPALIPFIEEAFYGKRPAHLMTQGLPPLSVMTSLGG